MYMIQYYLYLALGVVALAIELWALLDCVRRKPADFERAYKRTKGFWLGLTGGASAVGVLAVAVPSLSLLLFQLAAVIAASVYLADVKPAIGSSRGRGGNQGPYGPW
ncbi:MULTISPECIES: DUF2516 family protein [unclassified Arthrobacter]|uniref:DUF2516 family protein n=1 Tax=unclassified Arthrobacter TaxID=235627 RepID=UPI001D145C45|nr:MULTISPECIES: DUF2516 family protein [unclassified Arthrobacter]MCC3276482.1 DUF2516 family protein [Arthrobacter sp. zg-Y20]MCC9178532.1 DUF2516 family protein [Arthrobacter sp. zg-Y750]MDK1316642.1 DUF2516 family protein [Arthrobacter sp. zg.Y20]WIB07750.1 DUF2516 family protein [Arthrobacter sp. zg-Y20]